MLFFNAKQVQNIFLEIGWDSNEYHKFMTKCERETPKPRNLWRRPLCPMPSSVATVDRRGRRSTIVHLLSPFLFQTVLVWCSFWSEKKTRTLSCCLNLRIFRMRCYAATPLFSLKFTATQVETQSVQSINYNSLFSGATVFLGLCQVSLGYGHCQVRFLDASWREKKPHRVDDPIQVPGPSKFLIVFPTTKSTDKPFPDNPSTIKTPIMWCIWSVYAYISLCTHHIPMNHPIDLVEFSSFSWKGPMSPSDGVNVAQLSGLGLGRRIAHNWRWFVIAKVNYITWVRLTWFLTTVALTL